MNRIVRARNIVRAAGDHNALEITIRIKGEEAAPQNFSRRNWKNMNLANFKSSVESIQWEELYLIDNLDLANSWFEEKVGQILNQEAPWMIVQNRKKYRKWISQETKDLMKSRDETREKARELKSDNLWKRYKELRNICSARVKSDITEFFSSKYTEFEQKNDTKATYDLMKTQAGWKNGGPPKVFNLDGRKIKSPQSLADTQMDFFHKKLEKIQDELPPTLEDPLEMLTNALEKWNGTRNREVFDLKEATELEVLKALKEMGSSSSCGLDGMDAISLKFLAPVIYRPLTFIVNLSIRKSKFAAKWKIGKLVPIHKGKKAPYDHPSAFRPVSLLPTLSKIVERIVARQILAFMKKSKQMNTSQHAYQANLSTSTAICQLVDSLYAATDSNQIALLLAVDQSAAFDTVDHKILLAKMKKYNCSNQSLRWFNNYLSFRSQFVSIGGKFLGN